MNEVYRSPWYDWDDLSNAELDAAKESLAEYIKRKLREAAERQFLKGCDVGCCFPASIAAVGYSTAKTPTFAEAMAELEKFRPPYDCLALTEQQYRQLINAINASDATDKPWPDQLRPSALFGIPIEVYPTPAALHQRIRRAFIDGDVRLGVIATDEIARLFPGHSNPGILRSFPNPMRSTMSDEETQVSSVVDDPAADTAAMAANDGGSAEQPTVAPSNPLDQATATTEPAGTTEMGTAEATEAAPVETPAAVEAVDSGAHEPSPEAAPVETESGVEEIAEIQPLAAQLITLERALSVPKDDPDGDGMRLRTAYQCQEIRSLAIINVAMKTLVGIANQFNTDSRMDMLASLAGRVVRHEKHRDSMETAIGDVAIGNELERFAAEGVDIDALVTLCEWLVPAIDSMR